jgi:hypothetical protein
MRDSHSLDEFERLELPRSPHRDAAIDRLTPFSGFERSHRRFAPFSSFWTTILMLSSFLPIKRGDASANSVIIEGKAKYH